MAAYESEENRKISIKLMTKTTGSHRALGNISRNVKNNKLLNRYYTNRCRCREGNLDNKFSKTETSAEVTIKKAAFMFSH